MALPNHIPMIGLVKGRESKASYAGCFGAREDAAVSLTRLLAGTLDRRTFAYVWLAMDYSCNIVVVSEDKDGAVVLVDAISAFVPPSTGALEIPNANEPPDQRQNFMIAYDHGSGRINDCAAAEALVPERLICRTALKDPDAAFSVAKYGTSFVMHTKCPVNAGVVNYLRSKRVKEENVSALDIALFLEGGKITAITEYMWLDRLELTISDGPVFSRFRNIAIARKGRVDMDGIGRSKLIERHSKSGLITKERAIDELTKRAEFLGGMCNGKNTRISDYRQTARDSQRA